MESVQLTQGQCAICNKSISEEKAETNPDLGSVCNDCSDKQDEVFGPKNVKIKVDQKIRFQPVLGIYEFTFDWAGTRVKINGQTGRIERSYSGMSTVKFDNGNDSSWSTTINNLGSDRLKEIHKKMGGDVELPSFDFSDHTIRQVSLLEEPILSVRVDTDDEGVIHTVEVVSGWADDGPAYSARELSVLPMFHTFANLFVRYKFGLIRNPAHEGGFMGRNFAVRNLSGRYQRCGLTVRSNTRGRGFESVNNTDELRTVLQRESLQGGLLKMTKERTGAQGCPDSNEVINVWVKVMRTLLRYDWSDRTHYEIEDRWENFCTMQDVLSNILDTNEIEQALVFAREEGQKRAGSAS